MELDVGVREQALMGPNALRHRCGGSRPTSSDCESAQGTGYLAYEEIVRQLLDPDYYAMYSREGANNTQVGLVGEANAKPDVCIHAFSFQSTRLSHQ